MCILIALLLAQITEPTCRPVIIEPRRQTNSIFNPANPKREWIDYAGRTGKEREAKTPTQWEVRPAPTVPLRATGKTVVIVNPFSK
jgi:hypothetical protein